MGIAEFLLARIAEDEAVARAATASPWTVGKHDDTSDPRWSIEGPVPPGERWPQEVVAVDSDRDYNNPLGGCGSAETATHIAHHDPARVLAECEAKRRIMDAITRRRRDGSEYIGDDDDWLPLLLALPYADHPDYDPEWKV